MTYYYMNDTCTYIAIQKPKQYRSKLYTVAYFIICIVYII